MRIPALAFLLSLAACGFQPVHGTWSANEDTDAALSTVEIGNISDRDGQIIRNHLIDRLYVHARPKETTSHLEVVLTSSDIDLGTQKDATTSREEHSLTAHYRLTDKEGNELLRGDARSIVSYSKLAQQYATVVSKKDAAERADVEVAEQIVNRLALYFAEKKAVEQEKAEKKAASETKADPAP